MKSKSEKYVEYINENILSRIDYDLLKQSYKTDDKVYAKGVLSLLHKAMINIYGTETLQPVYGDYTDDDFVLIPGVVQGRNSKEFCLALLEIDLSSSGEHWGTSFLTEYGVIPQSADEDIDPRLTELMLKRYIPYDYCYTAQVPNDHHTNFSKMPKAVLDVLRTFHKHAAELLPAATEEHQAPAADEKVSSDDLYYPSEDTGLEDEDDLER